MEIHKTPSEQDQLFEARIKSATEAVNQARAELTNPMVPLTEDQKIIWENRLQQRKEELKRIIREANPEMAESELEEKIAA